MPVSPPTSRAWRRWGAGVEVGVVGMAARLTEWREMQGRAA
jgi:hypothetical protein